MADIKGIRQEILATIKNKTLTHEQTHMLLAKQAENILDFPAGTPEKFLDYKERGLICDLGEGHAPYSPRYILPDYEKFLKEGSEFLRIQPAQNLADALTNLLIMYHHVPSVTHFPVFIGRLDLLLEPFVQKEDETYAFESIKRFLMQIDRTVTDSFCHANIGPQATKAGSLILKAERELQNSTPNITMLYDKDITPDSFALECIETALSCAKPSFANHKTYSAEFDKEKGYGIASCYNGLPIAGGAFTLTRLVLSKIATEANDTADFFENALPSVVGAMCSFMDAKIKFLVEETPFFESNFLVREGFIHKNRFNGLFGMVGLAECVNILLGYNGSDERFGPSEAANALGVKVMDKIVELVKAHKNPYCTYWNENFMLHSQVGMDSDSGVSPGTRIPIGEEIDLYAHLRQAALFHGYFPSGTGDIFPFDITSKNNPAAILDIIKGAFDVGMRYFSTYCEDCDVIRITGYLVKRSDIEKLRANIAVVNDTVALGKGSVDNARILERQVRVL